MKKPVIISFAVDFGRSQRVYKHISQLSHDIGLLYSIHLALVWKKVKDIRITVYNIDKREITYNNHGYITRLYVEVTRDLNEIKVHKPDKKIKAKLLDLLNEIVLTLAKENSWDLDSINNAYEEVRSAIESEQKLPSYFDTFFNRDLWTA